MIIEIITACTTLVCASSISDADLKSVVDYYDANGVAIEFVRSASTLTVFGNTYNPEIHVQLSKLARDSNQIDSNNVIMIVTPFTTDMAYYGWASYYQQSMYVAPNTLIPTDNLIAHELGHLRGHPHYCDLKTHPIDLSDVNELCGEAIEDIIHSDSCAHKKLDDCKFDQSTRFSYRMLNFLKTLQETYLPNKNEKQ